MSNTFVETYDKHPHEIFFADHSVNSSIIADFFNVFCNIYYTDINTSGKDGERNLKAYIPVVNEAVFNENKKLIKQLAAFMSGEKWDISFIQGEFSLDNCETIINNEYEVVSLFSGGLDSFCGSFNNYQESINSIYCGYKLNTREYKYQRDFESFIKNTLKSELIIKDKLKGSKKMFTQRTRSLLFLAIAAIEAIKRGIPRVLLHENGVLSLNPEIYSRQTTKTTHPKTIYLFNELLNQLGIKITINHPFIFNTKGQIINALNEEFRAKIKDTHTCSKSMLHIHNNSKEHCGVCIPCMLRKISLAAYDMEKYDRPYQVEYGMTIDDIYRSSDINPDDKSYLASELKSSYEYFSEFSRKIKNKTIVYELNLKSRYYSDENYYEKTLAMLDTFMSEVDKFIHKNPI